MSCQSLHDHLRFSELYFSCYNFTHNKVKNMLMQEVSPPKKGFKAEKIEFDHSPHKQIDSRWVELKFGHNFTPRSYFASCIQAGNIYMHGGFNAQIGIMKDMMICCMYDMPAQWKEVVPKMNGINPGPLRNHTLSSYKSNLILIGGQKNVVENNCQVFRFNLLNNIWTKCNCVDQKGKILNVGLDSHSSVVYKSDLYVFGGYDSNQSGFSQKVIKINLDKIAQDQLTFQTFSPEVSPSPRANSGCCLVDKQIYLFGGGKVDQVYNDLWTWCIETKTWTECTKVLENIVWPEKRKGATMVLHQQSNNIFLFGGIKTVTKECNDIYVWMLAKKRWSKIHSNTNELYDPSPTVKDMIESPSISNEKRRKQKQKTFGNYGGFKIGLQSVPQAESSKKMHETNLDFMKDHSKNSGMDTVTDFKKKMSVVQQKKYREFLNRKKKLLSNIESGYDKTKEKRTHSPTSEALIFSLNSLGEQTRNQKGDFNLPKVIYNQEKGQVLGKKPCARDGHSALIHEEFMIILGGDRHMVSFNDAYLFKLNKGAQSLPHYE